MSDTQLFFPSVASFYDQAGYKMSEEDCTATYSWVLNDFGRAQIIISAKSLSVQKRYIEYGNYVTLESEDLPLWAGFIDTPRTWSSGVVEVVAYTPEYILKFRRGPASMKVTGTAGSIYRQIISYANMQMDTRIKPGDISEYGIDRQESLNYSVLLDDIKRVSERSDNDFVIEPVLDLSNRLSFLAHWYRKRGVLRETPLEEGGNLSMSDITLTEEGLLVNDVVGFGDGANWNSRPNVNISDPDSATRYQRRFYSKEFTGVTQSSTLEENTKTYVDYYSRPRRRYALDVLNRQHIFRSIRIGDTLPITIFSAGYSDYGYGSSDYIRVQEMAFDGDTGILSITAFDEGIEE